MINIKQTYTEYDYYFFDFVVFFLFKKKWHFKRTRCHFVAPTKFRLDRPVLGIPQRVILSLMGFFGLAIAYCVRNCLSVAITEMVIPLNNTGNGNESLICPADLSPTENTTHTKIVTFFSSYNQSFRSWSFRFSYSRMLQSMTGNKMNRVTFWVAFTLGTY